MIYIQIVSQLDIKRYEEDKKHIVISIRDSWEPSFPLPTNQNRLDALRLQFDDINGEEKFSDSVAVFGNLTIPSKSLILFNNEFAMKIKEFLIKYPDVEKIYVNCFMGISRSSGVAKAIRDWRPDVYEAGLRFKHNPNKLVYRILLEELKKST